MPGHPQQSGNRREKAYFQLSGAAPLRTLDGLRHKDPCLKTAGSTELGTQNAEKHK